MPTAATDNAALIKAITEAMNQLEQGGINVAMPAEFNALGARTDAGIVTFEHYDDGGKVAAIKWLDGAWRVESTTA